MTILIAFLLLVLLLGGLGFAVHFLWVIAVVVVVLWLFGWLVSYIGGPPAAGGRRRWYGRW